MISEREDRDLFFDLRNLEINAKSLLDRSLTLSLYG